MQPFDSASRLDGVGPLQLIVIHFRSAVLPPLVHAQIDDLRRRGLMRLVDSLVVVKDDAGSLIILDTLDAPRGDPILSGVLARCFFGLNTTSNWNDESTPDRDSLVRCHPELGITAEQLLEVADLIPTNSHALISLVEHLWAAELEIAAMEAQGHVLVNCSIAASLLGQMLRCRQPLFK